MVNIQTIPEGSIEIQTGLWLYEYTSVIGGVTYVGRKLYSSEGYCFYDAEAEVYDADGNVIDPEDVLPDQRVYMQYRVLGRAQTSWTYEQLNAKYISVPVQEGYEIVSVGQQTETA